MATRDDAERLDAGDALAGLRGEFVITDPSVIYADGNSLGRLPSATRAAVARAVEAEWGEGLIRSWAEWIDLPLVVGDAIGSAFLGAAPGQTVVADSTTVNFYKLVAAALDASTPNRRVVISDRTNFPTDRFVLEGLTGDDLVLVDDVADVPAVRRAIDAAADRLALVTFSHVDYRTGARADVARVTGLAHDAGALALWDLSHSVGAVAIDLDAWGVDLAVGCTYKYLNGGPGSPAFLYVRESLHDRLVPPIHGWFGAADQFAMGPDYAPAAGVRRFLAGTPSIIAIRGLAASVEVLAQHGIDALVSKSAALTSFVIELVDERLAPWGFEVATPRDPATRGAHVALRHPDAWRVCQAMITRARVIPDFREPDVIRLGFAPAYTRFVDVFDAVERIADLVERGVHLTMPPERGAVT